MEHMPMSIRVPIEPDNPSICRDEEKCIKCGMCKDICAQQIGVHGTYTLEQTDGKAICINCGQCANVCPTDSITEKFEYQNVKSAIMDSDKIVIVSTSPSVRAALGEEFGMPDGSFVQGKMVSLLRKLGVDYVLDTNFSADLTIMEEASEFIERVTKGTGPLPQFTSCCPAWVKFVVEQYPESKENLSTCRSPQGMLSAVIKEWYRDPSRADGKRTVVVSFMPCTAKKMEIKRPNSFTKGEQDTDYVVTTTELVKMIQASGINFAELEPEQPDEPFGLATGGGAIFGVTGGVTEAVIRRLVPEHDQATIDAIAEFGMRGDQPIKEFTVKYDGMDVNVCVVSGLANAHEALRRVKTGEANYHLIEVMACKGGCVMGGGQPVKAGECMSAIRTEGMYEIDAQSQFKAPDENPALQKLYAEFLDGKTHELLHNEGY